MTKKTQKKIIIGALMLLSAIAGGLIVMTTPLRFVDIVEPQINNVSPTNFYAEYKQNPNNYIFIDVRPEDQYAKEHPKGAINMPLETLYNQRQYLPKSGKTIVLICGGNQASGVAFSYLQHYGFFNIVRIPGGLPAWKAAGLPTVTGDQPNGVSTTTPSTSAYIQVPAGPKCT
jgi:rhodanese-related sulfurtransferase